MKTQDFRVDVSAASQDKAASLMATMQQWLHERQLGRITVERVEEPGALGGLFCRACFDDAVDANAFAAEFGGSIVAEEEPQNSVI